MLHVANDADDFAHARHVVARSSARPGVVNSDAFPNWIFAGPELPRSFCVDDGNRGRGGIVVFVEKATGEHRIANSLEKVSR